jgi:hypothetical protein
MQHCTRSIIDYSISVQQTILTNFNRSPSYIYELKPVKPSHLPVVLSITKMRLYCVLAALSVMIILASSTMNRQCNFQLARKPEARFSYERYRLNCGDLTWHCEEMEGYWCDLVGELVRHEMNADCEELCFCLWSTVETQLHDHIWRWDEL